MKAYFSTLCLFLLFSLAFWSCGQEKDNPFSQSEFTDALRLTAVETPVDEPSSKQELIQNIDNLLYIADYALQKGEFFAPAFDEETVYVRGKADGSIETERHTTVKGAPLISVRLTHGKKDFSTSTITRTCPERSEGSRG
jgi:hypothetical protein